MVRLCIKKAPVTQKQSISRGEEVFSACAGTALYRRSLFKEIRFFDERFGPATKPIDLGLRLQLAGYRCLYIPSAEMLHKGQGSPIRKEKYIINMTRNRIFLLMKNIAFLLIIHNLPFIIAGQIWHGVLNRNIFASSLRYISCIRLILGILEDHRMIQRQKRCSDKQVRLLQVMER